MWTLILIFGLNYYNFKTVEKFDTQTQCVKALKYEKLKSPKLKNNLFCVKRNDLPTDNAIRNK